MFKTTVLPSTAIHIKHWANTDSQITFTVYQGSTFKAFL